MSHQDWGTVTWDKRRPTGAKASDTKAVNSALRKGEAVSTEKKFLGGQNKATKGGLCTNAAKLEAETENFRHEKVSQDFSKALQAARLAKKMNQAALAQAINEKPAVIGDYEAGRAIPNGAIIQKLNRALGVNLPSAKKK
uniref:HTH cro/C1-type domain-containing protein n=1 Tax=Chromera velia CCMP2878 TaxID=1169474 RepID=A0A0G4FKA3_9ALVE|mmetsp:Transcript_42023/g.82946  ORF Transcript_42023/g.82946 Transcript_42023/m.82946 type:complete len:140 (+) Transcript_42023:216-635(+)|eukprot:Cvel_17468.t1-p1 / transcript=Cvel_17468.t1 / gene=Cvel_17468 / organism=Chromera_velia_CCMP2878 / gene_product=Multiprotein-bridging factor 1b, putative / transcript_product=Multiprotein-bridging factor 1b, putative / location=Cvel_scaffold1395:39566-40979(-) / protein_length=139 / sequence_SO=supercontig / SO=protein_coding / is_pseudo=false